MSKFRGTENPEYAKAMRDIRKSNAAGTHQDKRSKRKRTRLAKRLAVVKEETNE